jgi:hypothetical protein
MGKKGHSKVESASSFIKSQDKFGPKVSDSIKFKGKSQHKTFIGGFMTIGITFSIGFYSCWRFSLMKNRQRDTLMQSDFSRNLDKDAPVYLKDNDLKFWSSFTTPDFDNDDSEFAEIRLHYFSNMEINEGFAP